MDNSKTNETNQTIKINILRLYTDNSGKSHFGTIEMPAGLVDFAPPAPKVYLTKPSASKQSFFLSIPPNWDSDYHPVPSCQLMTLISGTLEVEVSDGTKKTFIPGNTAIVEDTFGDGHITRNKSKELAVLSVVQL